MIGWLSGLIVDRHQPGKLVLDVNGVGYDVETSLQTFFQLEPQREGPIGLHIHTVVREDALLLYGFIDKQERGLFRALIKVNGVGPKLAIAILSSISPEEFIQCIDQQNTAFLTKLPGIGKKTAERLVVEMKDNLSNLPSRVKHAEASMPTFDVQGEAIEALVALGYKESEAKSAIKGVSQGHSTPEHLIRHALQALAKR